MVTFRRQGRGPIPLLRLIQTSWKVSQSVRRFVILTTNLWFPLFGAELPQGSRVVDATPHGSSFWTQTAKLIAHLADGTERAYFLKVALGERGMRMMNGEFESMTLLYAAMPDFVPKPYAWGSYKDIPDTHFFLAEFRSVFFFFRREEFGRNEWLISNQ